MSEIIQIIFGVLLLAVVYIVTRYGIYWRIKRAARRTMKDLEKLQAFDEKTAVELDYAKQDLFKIGMRDFRPKAIESLVEAGIVGVTAGGRFFLKKRYADVEGMFL